MLTKKIRFELNQCFCNLINSGKLLEFFMKEVSKSYASFDEGFCCANDENIRHCIDCYKEINDKYVKVLESYNKLVESFRDLIYTIQLLRGN